MWVSIILIQQKKNDSGVYERKGIRVWSIICYRNEDIVFESPMLNDDDVDPSSFRLGIMATRRLAVGRAANSFAVIADREKILNSSYVLKNRSKLLIARTTGFVVFNSRRLLN